MKKIRKLFLGTSSFLIVTLPALTLACGESSPSTNDAPTLTTNKVDKTIDLATVDTPKKLVSDITTFLKVNMPESALTMFNSAPMNPSLPDPTSLVINDAALTRVKNYSNAIDAKKTIELKLDGQTSVVLDFSPIQKYADEIKAIANMATPSSLNGMEATKLMQLGLVANAPLMSSLIGNMIGAAQSIAMLNFLRLVDMNTFTNSEISKIAQAHSYYNMLHSYHQIIYQLASSNLFKAWVSGKNYELVDDKLAAKTYASGTYFDDVSKITWSSLAPTPSAKEKSEASNLEAQFALAILNISPIV